MSRVILHMMMMTARNILGSDARGIRCETNCSNKLIWSSNLDIVTLTTRWFTNDSVLRGSSRRKILQHYTCCEKFQVDDQSAGTTVDHYEPV